MSLFDDITPEDIEMVEGTLDAMGQAFGVKVRRGGKKRLPRTYDEWERTERYIEALDTEGVPDFGGAL